MVAREESWRIGEGETTCLSLGSSWGSETLELQWLRDKGLHRVELLPCIPSLRLQPPAPQPLAVPLSHVPSRSHLTPAGHQGKQSKGRWQTRVCRDSLQPVLVTLPLTMDWAVMGAQEQM